jgi:hypothetical protein
VFAFGQDVCLSRATVVALVRALARRQTLALAMRATVVSRIRATVAAFAAKEKDIYRLNPLGPKPKRILGVVYNSQVRRAGP